MLEKLLNQKAMITTILMAIFIGGVFSYQNIGKLEDAEVPIKTAMVITAYPGATAHEVELEVTDVLEKAIQRLENVDQIKSVSKPGLSLITVDIKMEVRSAALPQLWDHLRRKVHDVESSLPDGVYTPIINDDFADVYGMLYAVTADGFSEKEHVKYTEFIERELLEVNGIKRSQVFGSQMETIEVLFSSQHLANLNINPMSIAMAMQDQSSIVSAGNITLERELLRIGVGNKISSVTEIEELLIQIPEGGNVRLGDIATIRRSYMKPKSQAMYFNGQKAMALGLSNEGGVNVVELGQRVTQHLAKIQDQLPAGIDIHQIYYQPERVDVAVKDFMWNLVMSVGIVMIVLLFAMGYRSGLLISSGLIFTILGTLIVMLVIDLPLHRISLAAVILAMGMLVDNSIVVADGILVDLKRGVKREKAFIATAKQTALPLLGATVVAILAFLPLGMAPHAAGEFLKDLFIVMVISLLLSWVFAMIQTPFMAKFFYRKERPAGENEEAFNSGMYIGFRKTIRWTLKHKVVIFIASILTLIVSILGFRSVKMDFMSKSDNNQCLIEYNLPNGSNIEAVESDLLEIEQYLRQQYEGVCFTNVSLGSPPARYTLMRYMPSGGEYYGELIIEFEEVDQVKKMLPVLAQYIDKKYPQANFRVHEYGAAFSDYDLELQFTGPDPAVLRDLSSQAEKIFRSHSELEHINNSWGNKTKTVIPRYSVTQAQPLGLTRSDMSNSIAIASDGLPIGSFYEGDVLMPVMLKTNDTITSTESELLSIPVWGQRSQSSVPLSQITDSVNLGWEDVLVTRIDGKRAIRACADAVDGYTSDDAYKLVVDEVNQIELPYGYQMKWEGAIASQAEANEALFKYFPLSVGLMIIIIIGLFNNFKQPIIIFSLVPFSLVGISIGFNITGLPFNFLAIIGTLGLMGMMIKNAIVLLDEINLNLKSGKSEVQSIIDSTMSRLRPVMLASVTTILGMLPLIVDPMFQSMSIAIMFGLLFGAIITLVVVPVFYAMMYRVDISELKPLKA